jgi:hypothetical protein
MKKNSLLVVFLLAVAGISQAQNLDVHLEDVTLSDFTKLIFGEIEKKPYVITSKANGAQDRITFSMLNVAPGLIVEQSRLLLERQGYSVEERAGVYVIDKTKKADDVPVVYLPKHREVAYLLDVIRPLFNLQQDSTAGERPRPGMEAALYDQSQKTERQPNKVTDTKKQTAPDQLIVFVPPEKVKAVNSLLASIDTPTGEVRLKAAVYEVSTAKEDGSALQLVSQLANLSGAAGLVLPGDAHLSIKIGSLSAVLSALDRDSRFKSISRPQVRVKNGAESRFTVGKDVPVLGQQVIDRNGNPVQGIEYRPSGIILTATPEIREQVIELKLQQEISSFTTTTSGVNASPTLTKRSVSTTLNLQPGEVVVLAGLQDEKSDNMKSSVPFLSWLGGEQGKTDQSEILMFIEAEKL